MFRFRPRTVPRWLQLLLPAVCVLALLASGLRDVWNKQVGAWSAGVAPLSGSLLGDVLLVGAAFALVHGLLPDRRRRVALPCFLAALLVGWQVWCGVAAWPLYGQSFPWGVDNSSFLFRLHEMRELFPGALGGYNPWWNGGMVHFVGVTSGIHGWGILMWPFLALWEPHRFLGVALFAWVFVLLPWLNAWAMRWCGARWTTALLAALLTASLSRGQYMFFWQCGILGGLTTYALTLPLAALGYKLAVQRRGGRGLVVLVALLAWLSCLWTPGFFTCAGIVLGALANADRWNRRLFGRLLVAAAIACLLLAPWVWVILFPSRAIVSFVSNAESHLGLLRRALLSWQNLYHRILEWNPLLLPWALLGLALSPHRRLTRWTLPCAAVLTLVTAGSGFRHQSEFDRIAFQLAAFLLLPGSLLLGELFRGGVRTLPRAERALTVVAQGLAAGVLCVGLRIGAAHAVNKGGFLFWHAEPVIGEFTAWLRENVPAESRVALSGQLHQRYDWGRAAYLPILSRREMVAGDYYAFPKHLVEFACPPAYYRQSDELFFRFTHLYGISHWCVIDSRALEFCESHPERFAFAARFKMQTTDVFVFRMVDEESRHITRFAEGEGEIDVRENRIVVRPADPGAERLVLRYNWREGVFCKTPGAAVEPVAMDENIRFIGVRPNGAAEIEIGYRPSWEPMEPNFDGSFQH